MMVEFEVETAELSVIVVRHRTEKHRYLFPIIDRNAERSLSRGEVGFVGKSTQRECAYYAKSARSFAEREARRAGLLD